MIRWVNKVSLSKVMWRFVLCNSLTDLYFSLAVLDLERISLIMMIEIYNIFIYILKYCFTFSSKNFSVWDENFSLLKRANFIQKQ